MNKKTSVKDPRLAADYWLDYGKQIRGIVADSFLEEYDPVFDTLKKNKQP